ncbi:hypothetical protein [Pseudomonas chlororaphis]|uniref:hypothetical protein n=1 Tax=Pseudomonas chlororaphis TaxID=587753 RepID=UPI00131F5EC5|nr:hypothetical protein [Pseudomonas chlororaphis]QHC86979.1 hypothetical protein PchlR47_01165 [Pseudomonas chlororaphis]
MREFYIIAKKDMTPELQHSSEWPKLVGYSYQDNYFFLSEGKGYGLGANDMPESKAKRPEWLELFKALDIVWFFDFIDNNTFFDEDDFAKKLKKMIGDIETIRF